MKMHAFDTETVNRPGRGEACLLVTTPGRQLPFPRSFADIFDFLAMSGDARYVCWNMDFDCRAIIHEKFLPWKDVQQLGLLGRVTSGAGCYRLHYIPGKLLRVSRGGQSFELYDLSQFFAGSLDNAAEKYLGWKKEEIPRSWYNRMDIILSRGGKRAEKILSYAHRDSELTEALYGMLVESFSKVGVDCSRPISPGALALQRYADRLESQPRLGRNLNAAFQEGYFGGRVEAYTLGSVGKCNLYDIRSAYPSEIGKLESLSGLRLRTLGKGERSDKRARYGVYHIRVCIPDMFAGPLAVRRRDGGVIYPVGLVETVCGRDALWLVQRAGWDHYIKRGYEYVGSPGDLLFPDMGELYAARKDPVLGLAAKLAMNSLYGKLAESRDKVYVDELAAMDMGFRLARRTEHGRITNFVLALTITERVRIRLWEEIMRITAGGKRVHFCATDSLLTDADDVAVGDAMGSWELRSRVERAVIYGCGRYVLWIAGQTEPEIHLRGFMSNSDNLMRLSRGKVRARLRLFGADSMKEWGRKCGMGDYNVLRSTFHTFSAGDDKRVWPPGLRVDDMSKHCYYSSCFVQY